MEGEHKDKKGFFSKIDSKLREMGENWKANAPERKRRKEERKQEKLDNLDRQIVMAKKRAELQKYKMKEEQEKDKMRKMQEKRFDNIKSPWG